MSKVKLINAVGENYKFARNFFFEMTQGEGRMPTPDGMGFLESSNMNFDGIEDESTKEDCVAIMACTLCMSMKTGSRKVDVDIDELICATEQFKAAMELEKMAKAGLCNIDEEHRDKDGWPVITVSEKQYNTIKTLVDVAEGKFNDV